LVTAIANFHIICDEAVVNGSNVLTSIANRKTGINLNIQGTNLATLPADIDGHRAIRLNGTNQGFYFPVQLFGSFYVVQKFYRHATGGG
jgi:hypothetical protein